MAAKLDRDLSEVLKESGAPEALSKFLLDEGVTTCALFYDCVKCVDDLDAKIASKLAPPATSLRDVATIRNAWRRCEVDSKRAMAGEPLCPEDWEVPLHSATKNVLTAKCSAAYGVVIRARNMPCDTLLGRVFREREALTAFPLGRIRSLANTPVTKERKDLGNGVVLEHGVDKSFDLSSTVYGFWHCLRVLLNAYILVGVDGWCPKQAAEDYLSLVEEKLFHPRSPGLAAVAAVELQHRIRWVDLVRGEQGINLGQAMEKSISEFAGAWQYGPAGASSASGTKRQRDHDKPSLIEKFGSAEVCHSWNKGKCVDGDYCPNQRIHKCDLKGCGQKHRRVQKHKGAGL
jgi:hypothetical protein